MKTTALTLSALAVLVGLAACSKENFNSSSSDPQDGNAVKVTLSANQDSNITRAAIGNKGSDNKTAVLWSENDALSVFDGANKNIEFSIKSGTGETSGTFEGEVSKTSDSYVALYPYQSAPSINTDRNTISGVTLKSAQNATAWTFDPETALMVAEETTDGDLEFKNVVGYIKVTPTFDCKKITLTSNNSSDALAGTLSISIAADGTPTASIAANASSSVSISGTIAANTAYYIAVLPCTLSSGFKLVLTDSEGKEVSKESSKTLEIKRNTITDLGTISNTESDTTPYVTFSASSEQTFTMTKEGSVASTFEYSVGDGSWTSFTFGGDPVPFGGDKGDLKLRGKNSIGTATSIMNYITISFAEGSNVKVKGSGDIRTLIDWENYSSASTADARFCALFYGCKVLTSAPTLPAETLQEHCYAYMFAHCTSLETAPELPAETLAEDCYSSMFSYCTSLQSDIELPAEKLTEYCYLYMFEYCTSLTKITLGATSKEEYSLLGWLSDTVPDSSDGKTRTIYTDLALTAGTDYDYPIGWTVKALSELTD